MHYTLDPDRGVMVTFRIKKIRKTCPLQNYACSECDKRFRTSNHLIRHFAETKVHASEPERPDFDIQELIRKRELEGEQAPSETPVVKYTPRGEVRL